MAGDNLTVGLVVFLILIIIQFVVITKGSGRISEVAARFILDAMPGKQMAIDADLNGGLIDADRGAARAARRSPREAEFYGAMDGASKFVRGDAIAGLIITALNLVGGIAIGTLAGHGHGRGRRALLEADHRRRPGQPDPGAVRLDRRRGAGHEGAPAAAASART